MLRGAGISPEIVNIGERTLPMPTRPTVLVALIASVLWGAATLLYVLGSPSQKTMSWLLTYWGAFLGAHLFCQVLPRVVWRHWSGVVAAGAPPPVDVKDHVSSWLNAVAVAVAIGLYLYLPPSQEVRFYYDAFLMISGVGALVDLMLRYCD